MPLLLVPSWAFVCLAVRSRQACTSLTLPASRRSWRASHLRSPSLRRERIAKTGFQGQGLKETTFHLWWTNAFLDQLLGLGHELMHPEAYMERLACRKQVSDLKNTIQGPSSSISLIFSSVSAHLVQFHMISNAFPEI